MTSNTERLKIFGAIVLACMLISFEISSAQAQTAVLRPHRAILGSTYPVWAMKWAKWVLGIPAALNPHTDPTGQFCAEGQSGDVWFLAGSSQAVTNRTCTIPAGKTMFFPVNFSLRIATDPGETAALMRQQANTDMNQQQILRVRLDRKRLTMLFNHRAESPTFSVALPDGNLFGLAPGTYGPAISDGYWMMISPLSVGRHNLRIDQTSATTSTIVYTLNVVAAP